MKSIKRLKKARKLLYLLLVMVMAMGYSVPVSAMDDSQNNENEQLVVVNEYDIYVSIRTKSVSAANEEVMEKEQVDLIKSDAIEKELLRLSKLGADELKNLGYNDEQIEILHNYKGESIESNPKLRGVFADLSCGKSKVSASKSKLVMKFTWNWSNPPVLSGSAVEDIVAVRWKGTSPTGGVLNLALNRGETEYSVTYYTRDGKKSGTRVTSSVSSDDAYGNAYGRITMARNQVYYAKKGEFIISVGKTGTASINEGAFRFSYGHPTVGFTPSVSFPSGFGISFNATTSEMGSITCRLNHKGTITPY